MTIEANTIRARSRSVLVHDSQRAPVKPANHSESLRPLERAAQAIIARTEATRLASRFGKGTDLESLRPSTCAGIIRGAPR
jgi:hypothetical protein